MIASERTLHILNRIHTKGVINIKDIVRELGISETTVRRDFERLEQLGKLKRVQGGATLHDDPGFGGSSPGLLDNAELAMREKRLINPVEKQLAAQLAAEVVKDGESIFLDVGTSLVPLAQILFSRQVKIVTPNTMVINLPRIPTASIYVTGGQYHPHYSMLYGPIAKDFLERFNFDHAFIGCFGISLEQNKAYDLEGDSTQMKLAAMANAKQKHLLIDASKLNRGGFYAFTDLSRFNTIFCDSAPGEKVPANFCLAKRE
jgi:DeoR/GlpR family transcriptional regulator of sugar metabolism